MFKTIIDWTVANRLLVAVEFEFEAAGAQAFDDGVEVFA